MTLPSPNPALTVESKAPPGPIKTKHSEREKSVPPSTVFIKGRRK